MNKNEILEVLEMQDEETLSNLFIVSKVFNKEELSKVVSEIQKTEVKELILNYL